MLQVDFCSVLPVHFYLSSRWCWRWIMCLLDEGLHGFKWNYFGVRMRFLEVVLQVLGPCEYFSPWLQALLVDIITSRWHKSLIWLGSGVGAEDLSTTLLVLDLVFLKSFMSSNLILYSRVAVSKLK